MKDRYSDRISKVAYPVIIALLNKAHVLATPGVCGGQFCLHLWGEVVQVDGVGGEIVPAIQGKGEGIKSGHWLCTSLS